MKQLEMVQMEELQGGWRPDCETAFNVGGVTWGLLSIGGPAGVVAGAIIMGGLMLWCD